MSESAVEPSRPADKPNVGQRLLRAIGLDESRNLLWRLIAESFPAHRGHYTAAIFAMVVVAAATALTAWVMGQIIDAMSGSGNRAQVLWIAGLVAMIFVVKGIASYAQIVLLARAGNRIVADKQMQLYRRLLDQGMIFFIRNESSDILLRITQSAQMARRVIDILATGFVRDLLTLVGLVAVMVYQQPVLSLVGLIVGPVVVLGIRNILRRVHQVMAQEMTGLAEIVRVIQETSSGVRVVKSFAIENVMERRMDTAVRQVEKRSNKMIRLESATLPLIDTVTGLAIAAVVVLSSMTVFGQSPGTAGQLMSFVTAFLMAYEPANRLSRMRVSIESAMFGVRMMYELLDAPRTVTESAAPKTFAGAGADIRFEDVSFAFEDGTAVISDVSLEFPSGKTTALVGPSGGGKSTILNLILRLYDPTKGRILIEGIDIRDVSFAALRKKVAYVGQDTFLFSATVMENLRLGRVEATHENVIAAAKAAGAHEFISKLPKGYETQIGENGAFLSGGQKQRLAIARALLGRAQILLLDEATSALDSQTERDIQESLREMGQGRTVIAIAHRLSTIADSDLIVVLEAGRIVEQGTHEDLLAAGGRYAAMWNRQSADTESFDRGSRVEERDRDRWSKRDDAVPRSFAV